MERINNVFMKQALEQLYPKGKIWESTLKKDVSFDVRTERFVELYRLMESILDETDIRTASLKLNDYAEEYGVDITDLSVADARAAIGLKMNASGGQSVSYFENLLKGYGATGVVEECTPFVCGLSETGSADQCGDEDTAYMWFVEITENGSDIETLTDFLLKYAPAHTVLTVIQNQGG